MRKYDPKNGDLGVIIKGEPGCLHFEIDRYDDHGHLLGVCQKCKRLKDYTLLIQRYAKQMVINMPTVHRTRALYLLDDLGHTKCR